MIPLQSSPRIRLESADNYATSQEFVYEKVRVSFTFFLSFPHLVSNFKISQS